MPQLNQFILFSRHIMSVSSRKKFMIQTNFLNFLHSKFQLDFNNKLLGSKILHLIANY